MSPYFSIVIPMYNREKFIARALNSCLTQGFKDFELIVVDDGSADGSVNIVKGYADPRIKLICHEVNRGVGPARNTGVDVATGQWVVCFDSDDELLPGALDTIHRRCLEVSENICRLQFMVQMDTGEISPQPPLKDEYWDYIGYVKWLERSHQGPFETLPIVRRSTFEKVRYYNDRTLEGPYHLDFMKVFDAWSFPDIVRLYHHDAENQLTKPDLSHTIRSAKHQASSGELLLRNHGDALKKYAPNIYRKQVSGLATLCFLSGDRWKGIRYSFVSLLSDLISLRYWVILVFGLLGPKPLAWLKSFRAGLSPL